MKLSLRKAAVLQASCLEQANRFFYEAKTNVIVDKFTNVDEALKKAVVNHEEGLSKYVFLVNTTYLIRELIYQANASSGVSKILSENARHAMLSKAFVTAAGSAERMSATEIAARVEAFSSSKAEVDRFNRPIVAEPFTISIMLPEGIKAAKDRVSEIKRAVVKDKDRLLDLNVKTEITIPDDVAEKLRQYDVL